MARQTRPTAAEPRAPLERSTLLAARTLVDRMRALYHELERLTDAPITLHRALNCIGDRPGMTASMLAATLGMQRPAVSHVLRGLAGRGWIERRRHDTDQRSVRLHVTALGRQILSETGGRAVGTLQRSVRKLSRDQLRGLGAGLDALLAHLPAPAPTHRARKYKRSRP